MSKTLCLLAVIAVFAIIPIQVSALICYQCNSGFDPRCGDPMDSYSLGQVNCSMKKKPEHLPQQLEPVLCRKTIQKIYGKIRVVRGCGYLTDEDYDDKACVKRSGTHDVFAIYCSCTGDLCNTAPQNTITNYMILFSTTLIALVFKNLQC